MLADNFTVKSSLQDFDLSRIKSLRRLRIVAAVVKWGDDAHRVGSRLLDHAVLTVRPRAFFEVMTVSWKYNFCGVDPWADHDQPPFCEATPTKGAEEAPLYLRKSIAQRVREEEGFRFLWCTYTWEPMWKFSIRTLIEPVGEGKGRKEFANLLCEPIEMTYFPRRSRF